MILKIRCQKMYLFDSKDFDLAKINNTEQIFVNCSYGIRHAMYIISDSF
jgi:hypothetical protein